jgi:hypothetical protein
MAKRDDIDPTKNVLDLVHAETKRQDDLRKMESKSLRRELKNFKKYSLALDKAESKRINAIRAVDVGAVAVANAAAENRATTLAGQVNAAKDAQVVALKSETDPIRKDIGDLRQSQWTIAGGHDQVTESRAASGNLGLWIGVGVSIAAFMAMGLFQTIALGITIWVTAK